MANATVIYVGNHITPVDFAADDANASRDDALWRPIEDVLEGQLTDGVPAVLVVDESLLSHADILRATPGSVVVVAYDEASERTIGERVDISTAGLDSDAICRGRVLDAACRLAGSRADVTSMRHQIARTDREFHELSRIGIALMQEHDRNALLHLILSKGKQLTESDGAGLLMFETVDGVPQLIPMAFDFDSLPGLHVPDVHFPLDDTSIVSHAALTEEPVVIADVHRLPPGSSFRPSAEFQARYRYVTRSMLALPMLDRNHRVLGVVFFLNRKTDLGAIIRTEADCDRYVIPYTDREVRLARSLASQAAVSIETTKLYIHIERILESFITAAVTAIDDRDPTTAGHSLRVADLTTALAEAVDRIRTGPYGDVHFTVKQMRELRYAALLHDVGKVTVREDVLTKAKKLPPLLLERIEARFRLIRRTLQLEDAERQVTLIRDGAEEHEVIGATALVQRLAQLDEFLSIIRAANEPSVYRTPRVEGLRDIARHTFRLADGTIAPYLTEDELHYLELVHGTLDTRERAEVEQHVDRTYRFLAGVPWTDDLKNLPEYAYGHHEKLDGSGYPRGLRDEEIPVQTRMITLADIFDALTEADRPYKPAVTAKRAFELMRAEANAGLLDGVLIDILEESQVYRQILNEHMGPA